jgi:hypothetical protein
MKNCFVRTNIAYEKSRFVRVYALFANIAFYTHKALKTYPFGRNTANILVNKGVSGFSATSATRDFLEKVNTKIDVGGIYLHL